MFMRKVLHFSPRLAERFLWRVPHAAYCNKQNDKQSDCVDKPPGYVAPLHALMAKEAEDYLANLDEDGLNKMEEIKELMEKLRLENKRVPDEIPPKAWKQLITEHQTYSSRVRLLNKLFLDEVRQRKDAMKKREKAKIRQELNERKTEHPSFSINVPRRIKEARGWKGIQTMKSDIKVVIDLDIEQNMREEVAVFDQIQMLWSDNLKHLQPLNIHLTSINKNNRLRQIFQAEKSVFVNTHEKDFKEVFPDEDLVYLSPDGPALKQFDPNCTYIIGGLADLSPKNRVTFGKARKLGIRCASFPIRKYCDLSIRSPCTVLTLNCVYGILQDMYLHHSWTTAFRNNLRSSFFLYEDTLAQQKSEVLEKEWSRTFERNWKSLRSTKY
ncbi:tRNA methyltransferase 10 homolog B-like isoform X2 [Mercenaria mercenaria]|nr:tRNA methyltransferase 10 homolog B-like isoform X2 [Mercenaria mercenaria]XP_045165688.1 tRNA methyltransferase 10 homolog B-like isoform X2 [Mercenaria mercenaria]